MSSTPSSPNPLYLSTSLPSTNTDTSVPQSDSTNTHSVEVLPATHDHATGVTTPATITLTPPLPQLPVPQPAAFPSPASDPDDELDFVDVPEIGTQLADNINIKALLHKRLTTLRESGQLVGVLPEEIGAVEALLCEFGHCLLPLTVARRSAADKLPVTQAIQLVPGAKPFMCRQQRFAPAEEDFLAQLIPTLLKQGTIEVAPSSTQWAHRIVLVPQNGSFRMCLNTRGLNAQTTPDAFPVSDIHTIVEKLQHSRYFVKLDYSKSFWQQPLDPESRPYTAFRTPQGLYQFCVSAMGLKNSPSAFCRLMKAVLGQLEAESRLVMYIDDIVVLGHTFSSLLENLRSTLSVLYKFDLRLNAEKVVGPTQCLEFVGVEVDGRGVGTVRPARKHIQNVQSLPPPTSHAELHQFVGLVSFLRTFCPHVSSTAVPLYQLLSRPRDEFVWTPECENAFSTIKAMLTTDAVLALPRLGRKDTFVVSTDA